MKRKEKLYIESSSFSIWFVLAIIVLLILPIMWVIYASITSFSGFENLNQKMQEFGSLKLDNYARFLKKQPVITYLWNSIVACSLAVIINVMAASLGAFILKLLNVKIRKTLIFIATASVVIQFPLIAPNIASIMDFLGLKDTIFGISILYASLCLPFSFYVFSKYFDKTPTELTELAIMDGMPLFTRYFRIELPNAKPAIIIAASFCLFSSWNDFLVADMILEKSDKYTLNQGIAHLFSTSGIGLVDLFVVASISAVFAFFVFYIAKNTIFGELKR